jgi:predicted  nucleic acid-binding Zn-ribbon protein
MADACRLDEDTYDRHCPECDGKEFTYIDYDPDSDEGRANRAKYCQEWDPAVALERIYKEFPVAE